MPLPTVILRISLQSGAVVNLTPSSKYAWNVLGTDGKNGILGVRSFIKSPPELAVAYMPESWRVIDKPELTASNKEKPNGIDSILLDIPDHFPTQVITVQVAGKGRLPDWAFLEFGTAFGPTTTTTTEIFDALQKASPIAHIDSTQAPVLLLVPNSQARNYFHALKGAKQNLLDGRVREIGSRDLSKGRNNARN
ncbi:hypothetical protein BU17DRAFT_103653 [Hysterangium stoloniferum]|nr:hypothetical protein BU17DRAFT_103653 [Hysterangium stoloniferum]